LGRFLPMTQIDHLRNRTGLGISGGSKWIAGLVESSKFVRCTDIDSRDLYSIVLVLLVDIDRTEFGFKIFHFTRPACSCGYCTNVVCTCIRLTVTV
jgi:hypothetical protein